MDGGVCFMACLRIDVVLANACWRLLGTMPELQDHYARMACVKQGVAARGGDAWLSADEAELLSVSALVLEPRGEGDRRREQAGHEK